MKKKDGDPVRHSRFYLISIAVSLLLLIFALGAIRGLDYILMQYCAHEVEQRVEIAAKASASRMQTVFDNLDSLAGMLAHLQHIGEAKGLNLSSPLYVGGLQDNRDRGYGGPVLKQDEYPEIAQALEGEASFGYYGDKGMLFTVPVAFNEDSNDDSFVLYRRYFNRQGRSIFLPSLFDNKALVAICTIGEVDLVVANSSALFERVFGNPSLHEAMLELNMRSDLNEAQAKLISSTLGDFFVYSVKIPDSTLTLTGAINAEYFSSYFKDLFYFLGIGFCALLLIFNMGLLFLHFGALKREQDLLQKQRKLVERYAYKVTPPLLDLVDGQADNPDAKKRRELESKGQEILATTAKLREDTMVQRKLIPPSQHEYDLQNLMDLTFGDLKHRDKVKLLLNPHLPERLYGDPEAISRFFNSFLGLMLRFNPENLTFQLDGELPDPNHVNFEVHVNTECRALERKLVAGLKQSLQTRTEDLKYLEPHTLGLVIASRIIKDQGGDFSIDALPQGGLVLNFKMQQKVLDKGSNDFKYKPLPPEPTPEETLSESAAVEGSQSFEFAPPPVPVRTPRQEVELVKTETVKPSPAPLPEPVDVPTAEVSSPEAKTAPRPEAPVISHKDFKASGMSYNRSEALKFAAGNRALYDKFKKMFAEYAQRKLPLIENAFKNELWSEYINLLNGLGKGAHSVGAARLDSLCKDLVRAAKNVKASVSAGEKDLSYLKIHHPEMMDLLGDIIADIEEGD